MRPGDFMTPPLSDAERAASLEDAERAASLEADARKKAAQRLGGALPPRSGMDHLDPPRFG
jgi:hypothetical protein